MDSHQLNSIVQNAVEGHNDKQMREGVIRDLNKLMSATQLGECLSTNPSTPLLVGLRAGLQAANAVKSTVTSEPEELRIGNWDASKQAYV